MIMFSGMMPKRKEFFDLLIAHSDRVVASANATLRLVNNLGADSPDEIALLVKEVDFNEKSADKIKAEVIALLHKSLITPLDRDEIHNLTLELDKILSALRNVANAISMYNIQQSTPEAREMAALGADACLRLNRAVISLADKTRRKETAAFCQEIDEFESKADKVLKKAITRLFQEGGDVWLAVKLREFYFLLENVLDRCEDTAKTIEEILIENS
jgi:predicted phosphate transport protein (TIGR00153 family)